MMPGVGVLYVVLGCLVFCYTDAQQYYDQADYYRQYPQYAQYTQPKDNAYHGYTTPTGKNSNANSVQVIEVSIPSLSELATNFGISKSDEKIISGVIKQFLGPSSPSGPNEAYSPPNYQYGQTGNYQQPNYYQQQQYDYYNNNNYNYKQQQYEREQLIYEQKLREYYARYPSAIPTTTTASIRPKPNEIQPTKPIPTPIPTPTPTPIPDGGKSLADLLKDNLGFGKEETTPSPNKQPSKEKGSTEGGPPSEDLGHQTSPSPKTDAPKKSIDDLIENVFKDKPKTTTEEAPNGGGGKSLFELLAALPPPEPDQESEKSTDEVKTKSDVAGGDYGLDVRTDDSEVKRTKRSIIGDGLRRIHEKITSFGKPTNERHTRDHECNQHEGHSHHSYGNHRHHGGESDDDDAGYDGFFENHKHDKHKGRHNFENFDGYGYDPHYSHERDNQHPHPHPHPHFNPHHNKDYDQHEDTKPVENPRPLDHDDNPVTQHSPPQDNVIQPSRKPHSVDAGTPTDDTVAPANPDTRDPTVDIDIRGGFETRRKRHSLKRTRRSPEEDEGFVFQDNDETTPKDGTPDAKKEANEDKTTVEEVKKEGEEVAEGEEAGVTETGESAGEGGELDNRFGLFGGFHRQGGGRRPIAGLIGGVVNGAFSGGNGGYDPYHRGQYPQPYPPGNYPPPAQQPVQIYINNVATANAQAVNSGPAPYSPYGSNQNAVSNAHAQNQQNQFGSFQNAGAAGQASNFGADGSGQLSAANAMNQNYQNEFGFGSQNAAQSQAANFDNHGNLALTSSNSGTNHFAGPGGVFDEANSAAQSSLQGQFGTQNAGAQSNTYDGPNGSGSSAASHASNVNNGYGPQNSGSSAAANTGNFGGNSFSNAQSNTYANEQWGW